MALPSCLLAVPTVAVAMAGTDSVGAISAVVLAVMCIVLAIAIILGGALAARLTLFAMAIVLMYNANTLLLDAPLFIRGFTATAGAAFWSGLASLSARG